ncbi:MAG: hypothetical protein GXX89_04395 [Clostridiales bacterium]|jgi:peptide/nickel transport system substrate-binding protein|nr:hypothetical protein [Clostridiales bacterium]
MSKTRSVLCAVLALAMIFAFAACGKPADNGDKTPQGTEPAGTQSPGASGEPTDALPTSPTGTDIVYNSTHLVFSMDEFDNRPRQIQPGTELNFLAGNDVPSQLPWNCTSEGWLWSNVYDGLLYAYLGDVTDIRGSIAESWEHSEDYLTWTFKIREGVKFHDGTICDAPAIVRAWEYTQQATPANITNFHIESWEAEDDLTFVVKLSAPCAYFEQTLAGIQLVPVSPTALDMYGIGDNRAAIGTGPYYISSYTSGTNIQLKAFADYYLEDKMPSIETINFPIIADENTLTMALMNGDLDGARLRSVEQYYNLSDNGYEGQIVKTIGGANPLWLNAKKIVEFQKKEVRMAIDRFIDNAAIDQLINDGLGIVGDSIWPVGTPGYVPYDGFYYDPDEGNELLASVGMTAGDIKFHTTVPDFAKSQFEAIQDQLSKSGVEITLEIIEAEANFTYLRNGDWSLQVGSTGYSSTGPYLPWTYILKPDALIKQCWQDVYDPDLYQKMLDEYDLMVTASTWDEMLEHCKQLTVYQQEDFGALAGIQNPGFVAFSKEFKGVVFTTDNIYLQAYYMYV